MYKNVFTLFLLDVITEHSSSYYLIVYQILFHFILDYGMFIKPFDQAKNWWCNCTNTNFSPNISMQFIFYSIDTYLFKYI